MSKVIQGQNWNLTPASDGRRYSKFPDGTIDSFAVYAYTPGADSNVAYQIYDPVAETWGSWIAGQEAGVGGTVTQVTGTPLAGPFTFTDAVDITPDTLAESDAVTISAEGHQLKIRRLSPPAGVNWTNYVAYAVVNGVESNVWRVYKTVEGEPPPVEPPPPSVNTTQGGIYAIWISSSKEALWDLPYLAGAQVVSQWKNAGHTGPNTFNMQWLVNRMNLFGGKGLNFSIQINNNSMPEWMKSHCPWVDVSTQAAMDSMIGSRQDQVYDDYVYMYWHPFYKDQYQKMMAAVKQTVDAHPYKNNLIGIRFNFNKVGTEGSFARTIQDNEWQLASGVSLPSPSESGKSGYEAWVVDMYRNTFYTHYYVFYRASSAATTGPTETEVREGRGGLLKTLGDMEPEFTWQVPTRFDPFYDYCRPGFALGYSEDRNNYGGGSGSLTTEHIWAEIWQWNYWRVLCEMHLGVSYLGTHWGNLHLASLHPEYEPAFRFGAKYAGYHANPGQSPGAWIAFRQSNLFPGDYTMHFSQTNFNNFVGIDRRTVPLSEMGNANQRFGAFARRLNANSSVTLNLDSTFAGGLSGVGKNIVVTYLNRGGGTLNVTGFGSTSTVNIGTNNNWQTVSLSRGTGSGSTITLTAGSQPVTLHMVEVEKT